MKNLWASLHSQAALALACIDVHAKNWYSNVIHWFWFYFLEMGCLGNRRKLLLFIICHDVLNIYIYIEVFVCLDVTKS